MPYAHRNHAGNPGDVWKHLVLCECLGSLLDPCKPDPGGSFLYAETHAGEPCHCDAGRLPQYEPGFGKFIGDAKWRDLSPYFQIESQMKLERDAYLGSSGLVHTLLKRAGIPYGPYLWDTCEAAQQALRRHFGDELGETVHLRQEDGYRGIKASKLRPRLVLVDPPSTDWENIRCLLRSFPDTSVVAWYPLHSSFVGKKGVPKVSGQAEEFAAKTRVPVFQIQYGPAGRNTRMMIGCGVAVGGMPGRCLRCLKGLLPEVARELAAPSVKEPFSSYNI